MQLTRRSFIGSTAGGLLIGSPTLAQTLGEAPAASGFRILAARPGALRLRGDDEPSSAVWGYDAEVPGPVIRVKKGDEASVRLEAATRANLRLTAGGSEPAAAGPLFKVAPAAPVALGLINPTEFHQQIHIHGHVIRILHPLDDGWEPYWRDTATVPSAKTVHVAFVADNPGNWAIESVILDRSTNAVATWFEVAPQNAAQRPR